KLVALAVAVEVTYSAGVNPMGIADRQTGMVLCLVLITATASRMTWLARRGGKLTVAVLPLAAVAVILPLSVRSSAEYRTTTSWMPHAWARGALDAVSPRGLLMAQSDDVIAGVLAAQVVEGARPDVLMVVGHHLHKPAPERRLPEHEEFWRAIADAPAEEQAKVAAAWSSWTGPRSAERPGTGSLRGLDASTRPGIPVWSETETPLELNAEVSRWLAQVRSSEDRERLARGVNGWVAARLRGDLGSTQALAEAELAYRMVLDRVDPENVPAMVSLATVLDRLGRTQSAINLCQRALELRPYHATAHRNLGVFISKLVGPSPQAMEAVTFAASLEPWDPRNWRTMRAMCNQTEDLACVEEANAELRRFGEAL
ncbi:MAG: hypothetical protein ACPHRO_08915, partial [Nannocystaceae bacterium]